MRITPARYQLRNGDIPRRAGVLREQANAPRHLFGGEVLNSLAVEPHLPAERLHQTAQRAQQRRFAAAVRTDNRGEFAIGDRHVQPVGDAKIAVAQRQRFAG